jgi:drug/metabolite transporter (DMT)-like permease
VAALGVLGTGAAFVIFYLLIGTVGPARTMVVSYVAPGFAVAYGALLLGESITAATIVGLALIVGGSWLAATGLMPTRIRARRRERLPEEALDVPRRP